MSLRTGMGMILAFCLSNPAQAIPMVKLELPTPVVDFGSSFDVDLLVNGVTDIDPLFGADELLAFGFDVITPIGITFNGATVASPFNDDSAFFPNTTIAGSIFPGISGDDILLATLNFTPTTAGMFSVGISSDLSDLNEGLITFFNTVDMTTNIDVTVASVPEPPVWLLIGVGLLSLIHTVRRDKGLTGIN